MTEIYKTQLKPIQDKSSLKGSYVFISFSITLYFLYLYDLIQPNILSQPEENISTYFLIITIVSLSSTLLYFLKVEEVVCRGYLWLKSKINGYSTFKEVSFNDGINHPYISEEMNKFYSKILFSLSLLFISLIYIEKGFGIIIFLYLGILIIIDLITIIFKSSENLKEYKNEHNNSQDKKVNKKEFILNHITTIIAIVLPIAIILFFFNRIHFLVIIIMIFLILLLISFSYNWYSLEKKIKLIYFMKLFIQDKNMYLNNDFIKDFVNNIRDKLWKEAIFNLNNFLRIEFSVLEKDIVKRYHHLIRIKYIFIDLQNYLKSEQINTTRIEAENPFNAHLTIIDIDFILTTKRILEGLDEWINLIYLNKGIHRPEGTFEDILTDIKMFVEEIEEDVNKIPITKSERFTNVDFIKNFVENTEVKKREKYSEYLSFIKSTTSGYYFDYYTSCLIKLEEFRNFLFKELKLQSIVKLKIYQSRKSKKITKKLSKKKEIILKVLDPFKKDRKKLEDFFGDKLGLDVYKIKSVLDLYNEDFPEELFIKRCADALGKRFFKIFKTKKK